MKKIIYLANARIPTEKAHGIQITKMCESFASIGYDVELILPKRKNFIKEDLFSYYNLEKNFSVKYLPTLDLVFLGKIGAYISIISMAISSLFYIFFSKSKIIYSRDEYILFPIALFLNKKIVWEVHAEKISFVSEFIAKKAKKIVTITNALKEDLINVGFNGKKIIVAHDGVDIRDFDNRKEVEILRKEFNLPEFKKIIAYIGKFTGTGNSKGVDEIVRAFAKIQIENNNTHLLIVGANQNELFQIRSLLKEYKIKNDNISIVVHQIRDVAIDYMMASDILIMNYTNIRHHARHTSPLKLFEYMATGKAIIAPSLPSIKEVLNEKNAFLFETGNIESLKHIMIKAFTNPNKAKEYGNKTKELAKQYEWKKRAKNILDFTV